MRTLDGNHECFRSAYFERLKGYYCTREGARRGADGYLWVTDRIDDMLSDSGHLMSIAEVENWQEHSIVAETAIVSKNMLLKYANRFVHLLHWMSFNMHQVGRKQHPARL